MIEHFSHLQPQEWAVYLGLLVCSLMAVFTIVERLLALRPERVLPTELADRFVSGEILEQPANRDSTAGRVLAFFQINKPDPDALKAYAALEISRLDRGLFILDIVVGAAPLLGLLGTVMGLTTVFGGINPESGLPDAREFVGGIGMALTTTMVGLTIAIPALVGNSYLSRRVELLSAQINVGVERMVDLAKRPGATTGATATETAD